MDLLKRIAKWLDDNEIFQRERKSDEKIIATWVSFGPISAIER